MKRLLARLLLLVVLPVMAGAARADRFVIGVEDVDYAPLMSVDSGGEFRGYVRELLDLFAQRQGHVLQYRPLPPRRLTAEHLAGHVDAVFPDNPNWQAEAKRGTTLAYSEPAVPFRDVVMVPPSKREQPLHELGVVRGFTPKRFQPQIAAGALRVTEAGDPSRLIRMALSGRVDGVHVALPVALHQLEQLGRPGALVPSAVLAPAPYELHYRLSSRRHAELVAQFDRFLHEEQAAIAALQRRYGLIDRPAAAQP